MRPFRMDDMPFSLLLLKIMVDPVVDKADDKTQNAADKETDGIFHGAVIVDIYHDQLKDTYHR